MRPRRVALLEGPDATRHIGAAIGSGRRGWGLSGLLPAVLCLACVALSGCKQKDQAPKSTPGTLVCRNCGSKALKEPKLLVELPDYAPTPDGMAMDAEGNIIVACPNYADKEKPVSERRPAVFIKIDKNNNVTKLFECPVLEETGIACPMGIAFGPEGDLYVCDNQGWIKSNDKGRVLALTIKDDKLVKTRVVAKGMSHPNGIRIRDGYLYVTQSMLPKIKSESGCLVSAVYRFIHYNEGIEVTNTKEDPNLLFTIETKNMDCQYGLDGIVFDKAGNLYVGNFGDGTIHKITFDEARNVTSNTILAKSCCMRTTDGICIDEGGNIYVADFSENAVCIVSPEGKVRILAKSLDCDGSGGGLDQPGEPIVRGNELVVVNFDMVTGPDKVNTGHDKPYTMSVIDLTGVR
ncbi:MAG: SMP-30/gluconolactonase/LRE family protein [Planctomycetota bacterium]|jgi:sugar lactone lactonase YvrE